VHARLARRVGSALIALGAASGCSSYGGNCGFAPPEGLYATIEVRVSGDGTLVTASDGRVVGDVDPRPGYGNADRTVCQTACPPSPTDFIACELQEVVLQNRIAKAYVLCGTDYAGCPD
jgi:hypothetical protein